ncbi:hypothetical protein [Streptomyces sp. CBMA29]|uniref:hypothetical protein n=1 Tax=Streptomyces sp. CBMA29 TaxID=1896314 RepID=UPI001662184B|nr:hypothetical protein [Streptomyces sp. CBMA29]MBD0733990.1 hypothetical protein [Streptomyces sp. CBMA29]
MQDDKIDAIVQGALLRTAHLMERRDTLRMRLRVQGKSERRSKVFTTADAAFEGALSVLAAVLATGAAADVLIDGLPSSELAERHLLDWDAQRTKKALNRAIE